MRPRLLGRVRARRHVIGEDTFVVITDDARGLSLKLGEREWRLVRAMDGSRDLEGLTRIGVKTSAEELEGFVRELERVGLLDADAEVPPEDAFARDVPVRALEGARFACDGSGHCCASFDTVLFTPLDQARARAAAPEVQGGGQRPDRVFLPAFGLDETVYAVTAVRGACAYQDPDTKRCRVHSVRPHGCRTFPLAYLDVGSEIRVSLRPECACALAWRGELLDVPETGAQLPRELHVPRLDAEPDYLAWLDALAPEPEALLHAADALGAPLDRERRWAAARAEVDSLLRRHAYRADDDPTRRGLEAVRRALDLDDGAPDDTEERFLRASLFVLQPDPDRAEALRRLALVVLVARRFSPEDRAWSPAPLATVAALVRGHGLTLG